MRLRIAKKRNTAAFERVPHWKLMVLTDRPVRSPLASTYEVPVVEGTRDRKIENHWIAEYHRKQNARDSYDNRFRPGELTSIEQKVRDAGNASRLGSRRGC